MDRLEREEQSILEWDAIEVVDPKLDQGVQVEQGDPRFSCVRASCSASAVKPPAAT
jgi:hypothetical protein